ncbi:DUF305 domain-containing protein [Streptomyces sp. NPDC005899]|uniref:DUF305 domain-containing protein n=1 Tax=Streptomyces sp. NPDC005899 TaxID=3155716 RepID=UPI0033EA75C6
MKAASHLPAALLVPVLLLLAASTSCSPGPEAAPGSAPGTPAHATSAAGPTAAPPPSADPGSTHPPSAGPTDFAWIQLMVPMDEGAVSLLALAERGTADPRLRPWAADLRTALTAELASLRRLRDRMGLPGTDVHKGHDMPGMVTDTDLAQARTAEGAAFDRLLVDGIRDHLRQSEQVSRSESTAGGGDAARERARALVDARREQLAAVAALPAPLAPGAGGAEPGR